MYLVHIMHIHNILYNSSQSTQQQSKSTDNNSVDKRSTSEQQQYKLSTSCDVELQCDAHSLLNTLKRYKGSTHYILAKFKIILSF